MAVVVIYALEMVYIEDHRAEGTVNAPGARKLEFADLEETAAVIDAGQCIGDRLGLGFLKKPRILQGDRHLVCKCRDEVNVFKGEMILLHTVDRQQPDDLVLHRKWYSQP